MKLLYTILFILVVKTSFAQLSPIVDSIPMSDGRKLAADVYIPAGMTSGPVILIQTPYNRLYYRYSLPLLTGLNINSSNYIFVITDWRGFYGSQAAAYTGAPAQGFDGYNTVEWIAQQSWSNGKVGTWGPSALGRVQFETAKKHPPHLLCMCPLVAGPQYDYQEYFPGGCLRTEYVQQLTTLGFGLQPFIMAHTIHDATWTYTENSTFYDDSILVPCFMIGGWYDHTIETMLPFFAGIRANSPANVRDKHRLLMGPWVHGGSGQAQVGSTLQGQLNYPNAAHWNDSLALLFFDYHLRNISNNWNTTAFVQYYQLGTDAWQTSATWPPTGTTPVNFYMQQNNSLDVNVPANSTGSLSYNYDPNNPSPTIGGPTLKSNLEQGPYDQTDSVESRNDILVFTTNTLTQDAMMKGQATVHLKISSNRKDTDFDIRLTDVYPDGRSMLVNDGVRRMRFRNGYAATDTAKMVPGTVYDCVITLPNTAITFLAGHKIRVDVTSSNYPRFNRNMNTDGPMYPGNNMDILVNPVVANNTVYTNSAQLSYITLPLVNFVTGVEENVTENSFEVYPNPANDKLFISFKNNSTTFILKIFNELGQEVLTQTIQNNISKGVDISKLNAGIYFVRVDCEGKVYSKKISKY